MAPVGGRDGQSTGCAMEETEAMTLGGEPCGACKGKGQRRCPTCRGNRQVVRAADGTVNAPHTPLGRAIGRKRMVDCPACQARGAVRCTECGGSGRRPGA